MRTSNDLNRTVLGVIASALFMLAGCGARSVDLTREPAGCELDADAVCASAMENYLSAEADRPPDDASSEGRNVVPLITPVMLPGGELAAEVDCYVNLDPKGSSLVYVHLAIPPNSSQAALSLRNHDLCVSGPPKRETLMMATASRQ